MIGTIISWFMGSGLSRILRSVDTAKIEETKREQIRAQVIETHLKAEAENRAIAMQARTFWIVWALFAVPLGLWWAAVMIDTIIPPFGSWGIPVLPNSIKPWADTIFGSIFGSGAAVGAAQALAMAIRGWR
jgi:hypothetical protein